MGIRDPLELTKTQIGGSGDVSQIKQQKYYHNIDIQLQDKGTDSNSIVQQDAQERSSLQSPS